MKVTFDPKQFDKKYQTIFVDGEPLEYCKVIDAGGNCRLLIFTENKFFDVRLGWQHSKNVGGKFISREYLALERTMKSGAAGLPKLIEMEDIKPTPFTHPELYYGFHADGVHIHPIEFKKVVGFNSRNYYVVELLQGETLLCLPTMILRSAYEKIKEPEPQPTPEKNPELFYGVEYLSYPNSENAKICYYILKNYIGKTTSGLHVAEVENNIQYGPNILMTFKEIELINKNYEN